MNHLKTTSITILLNSGATKEEKSQIAQNIAQIFAEQGSPVNLITIQKHDNFPALCEKHIDAAKKNNGLIVAAGGDGTVNTVANICYQHEVPLGIIPLGTFNYFARDLSIPTDMAGAIHVIIHGVLKKVTVGAVNKDHIFLNNASFGLYTKLIRHREAASSHFGRWQIIGALAAVYSLLHPQKTFSIKITTDLEEQWHKTAMVFVGNNTLQLENIGLNVADCTKQNNLAIVILNKTSRFEMCRFLLRGMLSNLTHESKLKQLCASGFEVKAKRTSIDIVIDGEIIRCKFPLTFLAHKSALEVMVPAEAQEA